MADERWQCERYREVAEGLVATDPRLAHIRDSSARIAYLSSDMEKRSKGREVFGQCERIPDRFKWAMPWDFAITVYEPNVEGFDDERIRILLLHELMHVGIERDGNEERYSVIPHDVEEFRAVIDEFGVDWWRGRG